MAEEHEGFERKAVHYGMIEIQDILENYARMYAEDYERYAGEPVSDEVFEEFARETSKELGSIFAEAVAEFEPLSPADLHALVQHAQDRKKLLSSIWDNVGERILPASENRITSEYLRQQWWIIAIRQLAARRWMDDKLERRKESHSLPVILSSSEIEDLLPKKTFEDLIRNHGIREEFRDRQHEGEKPGEIVKNLANKHSLSKVRVEGIVYPSSKK